MEKLNEVLEEKGLLEFTLRVVNYNYDEATAVGPKYENKGYQVIKDNTRFVKATGKKDSHYITDLAIKVADVDEFVALED